MSDLNALLPCPFCGEGQFARVERYQFPPDDEGPAWKWGYHVICDASGISGTHRGCGGASAWGETEVEAIAAWNRRALSPLAPAEGGQEETQYLIRKSGAWYRPNSAGYTNNIAEAGRYTLTQAEAITHPNGPDGPRDNMSYEPAPALVPKPAEGEAVPVGYVTAEAVKLMAEAKPGACGYHLVWRVPEGKSLPKQQSADVPLYPHPAAPVPAGVTEAALRESWLIGRQAYCAAGVLADEARTEREWQEALPRIRAALTVEPSNG